MHVDTSKYLTTERFEQIRHLADQIRAKVADITTRDKRIANQRAELDRLTRCFNERGNSLVAAQKTIRLLESTLESQFANSQPSVEVMAVAAGNAAEASRLRQELSAKEVEIRHLRGGLAEKEAANKQLRENVDHFSNQVVVLRGELKATAASWSKNLDKCCAAKEETALIRDKLSERTKAIESLTSQVEILKAQLAKAKKASEKPSAAIHAPRGWSCAGNGIPVPIMEWVEKSLHNQEVAALKKEIERLLGELDDANRLCKYRGDRLNALEKLVGRPELKKEIDRLKGELDAANRHCKIRGDRIAELEKQLDVAKGELSALLASSMDTRDRDALIAERDAANRHCKALEKQIQVFVTERRAVRDLLD